MTHRYTLHPENPGAHLFRVSLTLDNPGQEILTLRLPDWIPGSYMIRDFARNIVEISAVCGGEPVPVTKTDKSSWQLQCPVRKKSSDELEADSSSASDKSRLVVSYLVYAWELSVRAAHLDTLHGFFNGTSVFLFPVGGQGEPCEVDIKRPDGNGFNDWQVATAMQPHNIDAAGFGTYRTHDYDELIDHPVEMGTFERIKFDAVGVPHEVILTGSHRTSTDALQADLAKICEAQIRLFGEPAPMSRFLF